MNLLWRRRGLAATVTAPPVSTGPSYQFFIGGVLIQAPLAELLASWEIVEAINAPTTFRGDVLSKLGTYRPAMDAEIYMYEAGVLLFGGLLTQPREHGVLGEGRAPIITSISAHDFSRLLERRNDVNETIVDGSTLKQVAQQLITAYLPGLTLDPAQTDGPTINEIIYEDAKLADAMATDLPLLTGTNLRISFDKKVRYVPSGTEAAPYNIAQGNGVVEGNNGEIEVEPSRIGYANRVVVRNGTLRSVADNTVEQLNPDIGIQSTVITASDTTDQIGLDAIAVAYLARSVAAAKKKITYTTRKLGFRPGQTQTVTSSVRNLSGTYLITEVRTYRQENITWRRITAIEGNVPQSDFRDVYRQWSGGGVKTAGVAIGVGGGTTVRSRSSLGGSEIMAIRSDTPTWVTSSGGAPGTSIVRAQLDTVARGGLDAIVTATMRVFDPGNTIQARLFDVSTGLPVAGTSAVVSLTSPPQTVSWNVTLNAGAHVYEMNYLPGLANMDVQGSGYVD